MIFVAMLETFVILFISKKRKVNWISCFLITLNILCISIDLKYKFEFLPVSFIIFISSNVLYTYYINFENYLTFEIESNTNKYLIEFSTSTEGTLGSTTWSRKRHRYILQCNINCIYCISALYASL